MKLSSFSLAVLLGLIMTCSSAEAAPAMSPVSARPSKTEAKTKANTAKTDNTLLIKFAAGVDLSSAKKLLQSQGFKAKKVFHNLSSAKGHTYLSVVSAKKDATLNSAAIQALISTAGIEKVSQNYEIHALTNSSKTVGSSSGISPSSLPDDPLYSQLWGMQNMDMSAAWDLETGNSNNVVFVIDTGIDTDHPELVSNLWTNPGEIPGNGIDDDSNGYVDDVHGIDVVNNDSDPEDDYGHGTHVSGTIGAEGNNGAGVAGVNWDVKIGACKFLDAGGSGSLEGAVQCFDYVLGLKNAGINVVATNNSWGGGGAPGDALNEAIEANINAGVLPVLAAGNETVDNDSYPMYPCAYTFSGVQGDSICVAAIDSSNNLAWFSSYGLTSVDVAAPGVDILSAVPEFIDPSGYASWSGTSMATPHVTGLAALLAAHNPSSSLTDIRQAILYGSVPTESLAGKVATGGRVNGYISLTGHFPPIVSITSPASRSVVNGNVSIEAEASSDYGIAQVEFFVNDASVGVDSTAPYSVTWDASVAAPDMYTVKAVATDTENAVSSKQIKVYRVNSSDKALILDLGSDNHSGEAVGAALARNNVRPEFGNSITAIDPAVYPRTFVCLGYYPGHVLNGTESADLSAYLDNGGTLYMEGGDTWAWDPDMPIHSYFGIKGVADGTADLATVSGISGSIVDGISFASVGVNTYVDHLEPENGGTAIWQNSSPVYVNGISNQTENYRTIGCSFEFGNISDKAIQTQVMAAYLSFFSLNSPSVSITSPVSRSVVNGNVSIEAEASSDYGIAQVEFFVNDASVGVDSTAPYSVTWDASAATPDMYTIKAVAADAEGAVSAKQIKVYLVNGSSKALVLDLGSDNHSGEAVGAALARNNVRPEFGNSITAIDPAVYPRTFACLGYFPEQHVITDAESASLSAYLDNGGTLYMEGGDTWAWDPDMPIHSYFGIKGVADGTADLATVSGISGSIVDGISFASVGVNTYVDHLEPENGGTAIWQNSSPVYVNGISNQTENYRTIGCSFEFGNISDKTIQTQVMAAYLSFFGLNSYTVTPSTGTGGSINPDTPQTVPQGETTSFVVTPDAGYVIDTVEGCGGTLSDNTYTTGAINADCTVTASFTISYTVTPSAGTGGSISPDTPQTVNQGETTDFTVTPNAGYVIDKVEGCGGSLNGNIYTTGAINADCTVTASFMAVRTWTVFPLARTGGSISPDTPQTVNQGETTDFTVIPNYGYAVKSVSGCGGSLSGTTYTTGPITRSCVVRASFKKLPKHFVIPFADRHGSISPHRPQKVLHGETTSFSITPKVGYAIKSVSGCGGSLSGNTYTTGPVTHTCMVRASFRRN